MMTQAQELRQKAALCRRAASTPTSGSAHADYILVLLAEQIERDALLLEKQPQAVTRSTQDSR
jgi:hypothetical protein